MSFRGQEFNQRPISNAFRVPMKLSTAVKSAVLAAPILVVSFAGTLSAQSSSSGASLVACDATMASGAVAQINSTHSTVYTSILIDAASAEVWRVLTDFENMSVWSSETLQGMSGELEDGGSVVITFLLASMTTETRWQTKFRTH